MVAETDAQTERFPRRSARRQQTRMRILESALNEFQRVGYADATMNAIAEAADVHVTTLFTHFKAKRDLATTLADEEIDKLAELIAEAKPTIPFFEFFRSLVLATAELREKDGDHKTGRHELLVDPELALSWLRFEEKEVKLLADYIASDYGLDPRVDYEPYLAAHALISSGVISHTRWRRSKPKSNLLTETQAALDLAERMARAILPLRPLKV
jgi:AcrR family transcriptional regulator